LHVGGFVDLSLVRIRRRRAGLWPACDERHGTAAGRVHAVGTSAHRARRRGM